MMVSRSLIEIIFLVVLGSAIVESIPVKRHTEESSPSAPGQEEPQHFSSGELIQFLNPDPNDLNADENAPKFQASIIKNTDFWENVPMFDGTGNVLKSAVSYETGLSHSFNLDDVKDAYEDNDNKVVAILERDVEESGPSKRDATVESKSENAVTQTVPISATGESANSPASVGETNPEPTASISDESNAASYPSTTGDVTGPSAPEITAIVTGPSIQVSDAAATDSSAQEPSETANEPSAPGLQIDPVSETPGLVGIDLVHERIVEILRKKLAHRKKLAEILKGKLAKIYHAQAENDAEIAEYLQEIKGNALEAPEIDETIYERLRPLAGLIHRERIDDVLDDVGSRAKDYLKAYSNVDGIGAGILRDHHSETSGGFDRHHHGWNRK